MIRSLSKIRNISVIDQNIFNNLYSFSDIRFDENEIGSGAFGSVHKVQSIDGLNSDEYLLKIFTNEEKKDHAYDTIQFLHEKLKARQLKTGLPIFHEFPELLGLPFLAFKGYDSLSERECLGFLMYDLNNLGFEFLGKDIEDGKYQNLPIQDKFYLGYQVSKVIDFLHEIKFIHSDFDNQSIFIDSRKVQIALIDFDSGYHFDKQSKPSTIGKISQWASSQFQNLIGKKISSNVTHETRVKDEYWKLANCLFEIIFGTVPYFFLKDAQDKTRIEYLKSNDWPLINNASPLLNQDSLPILHHLNQIIENFTRAGAEDLVLAFKKVFNEGYKKENKRLSANEWRSILFDINKELNNPPILLKYVSDKKIIKKKNEGVNFNWETLKFQTVFLNGYLCDINQTSETIKVQDSSDIVIKIKNDFGELSEVIKIEAKKVEPKILEYTSSKEIRNDLTPIKLSWRTQHTSKVFISSITAPLNPIGTVEVDPTEKSIYILKAVGHFDQVIEKQIEVDVIKPKILEFYYELNLIEGINNVDLIWKTENATNISITPKIGIVSKSGLVHVKINKETEFLLSVSGHFGKISETITAHPFPVPVIEQLMVETPKIHLESIFHQDSLNFPFTNWDLNKIEFSNIVEFEKGALNNLELTEELMPPTFENKNALLDKYVKENITFTDIYNKIKEKIYTKIS